MFLSENLVHSAATTAMQGICLLSLKYGEVLTHSDHLISSAQERLMSFEQFTSSTSRAL